MLVFKDFAHGLRLPLRTFLKHLSVKTCFAKEISLKKVYIFFKTKEMSLCVHSESFNSTMTSYPHVLCLQWDRLRHRCLGAATGGLLTHCNILQSVQASARYCCCRGRQMWLLFHTTFTISESICLQHKSSQKSTLIPKIKGSLFPIAIFGFGVKILIPKSAVWEKKKFERRCIQCIMALFRLTWLRCPAFIMVKVMRVLGHIHPSNATEA